MLSDYWIASQLLAQFCILLLLLLAGWFAVRMLRHWKQGSLSTLQLALERQSYLVSAIVKLAMLFQFLLLLMLLITLNNHLPGIIRGAMCAAGTLEANAYGYPLLWSKLLALPLYAAFLTMQYLDNAEPGYPLTPHKFWLVLPAVLFIFLETVLMLLYYARLQPDLIVTCCSVAFVSAAESGAGFEAAPGVWLELSFAGMALGTLGLLVSLWWKRMAFSQPMAALLYLSATLYSLRFFFVKYIYGLPTHFCLYDLFFAHNYYVGYVLFGAYLTVLTGVTALFVHRIFRYRLKEEPVQWHKQLRIALTAAILIGGLLPVFYWLKWPGSL
jgi:hypothetical protein